MVYIYVLQLQKNKYYVGKTTNPKMRLETHFDEGGSWFTRKYKPLQILQVLPDCNNHDEQRVTQEYMAKYGISNVRGGPWTQMMLSDEEEAFIQKLIDSEGDRCYTCGEEGHFAKDCDKTQKQKLHKEVTPVDNFACQFCGKEFESLKGCRFHENIHCSKRRLRGSQMKKASEEMWRDMCETSSEDSSEDEEPVCYRCGRIGHYATTCYAVKHRKGYYL